MARRVRLDAELVRRGMATSRGEARDAIEKGLVTVKGVPASRPATLVAPDEPVALAAPGRRFVSRGGDKLDGALDDLEIEVAGKRWLDAGASTGGFTDCLLQREAIAVVAVDVGYGQLAWELRNDPRVTVLERVNVRTLTPDDLPWQPDGVVADLSFISLRSVLQPLAAIASESADVIALVKPQFEVGRGAVGKGGVVRDPDLWRRAIDDVVAAAAEAGLGLQGVAPSRVRGPAGNREFFVWLRLGRGRPDGDLIARAVAEVAGG